MGNTKTALTDRIATLQQQIVSRHDPFDGVKRDVVVKADVAYGETTYTYLFLRSGGQWFSTASRRHFDSWGDVLDFLSSSRVQNIYVADGWKKVVG